MKKFKLRVLLGLLMMSFSFFSTNTIASEDISAYGKYSYLLQKLHCPKDHVKYGDYKDYGYWKGGDWCGQHGKAGFWVWVAPNWYIWEHKN